MPGEIINRVEKSQLVTLDIEQFIPNTTELLELSIKEWLENGFVLREKPFREKVESSDWNKYKNKYVYISLIEDAIIPDWSYFLIFSKLVFVAKKVIIGNEYDLIKEISRDRINNIPYVEYENKRVLIKGCAKKEIPKMVFSILLNKILPKVKTMMFGEACSTVPIFKRLP